MKISLHIKKSVKKQAKPASLLSAEMKRKRLKNLKEMFGKLKQTNEEI
jgi:hypothetical protein